MNGTWQIRRRTAVLTLVLASLGGGLVAALATRSGGGAVPVFVSTAQAATEPLGNTTSFAPIVKKAAPAVVNISTTTVIKADMPQSRRRGGRGNQNDDGENNPFFNDPLFRRFFGDQSPFSVPRSRRESALGSGVIVNPSGYIITNNHVVENATSVKVTLADRREFTAKVVGTDPQTDIAVIKIEAKDLPALTLSDSSRAQVGDLCLAIGDPFGIGQTVTMGIVSATGRSLGGAIEAYEDFIQTDAAINPGNSGGALINARGELIGINTAILSGSGANAGVGFAIPINMARSIMDQLMKSGKVVRGYMGATLQDVDTNLAKQFKLPNNDGALITDVEPGSPAASAGLKSGDVITSVNGEHVIDMASLRLRIASFAPGTAVKLQVYRDGAPHDMTVTLKERPSDKDLARGRRGGNNGGDQGQATALDGVSVQDVTPDVAQQLNLPRTATGVVVTDVDEASQAAAAGLQQGDVITQVNRQPVKSADDFERLVNQAKGQNVLLMVNRGGVNRFVAIEAK